MLNHISRPLLWKYIEAPPSTHASSTALRTRPPQLHGRSRVAQGAPAATAWRTTAGSSCSPARCFGCQKTTDRCLLGDRRPWGRDRWDYLGYTPEKRGGDVRVAYHNPACRGSSACTRSASCGTTRAPATPRTLPSRLARRRAVHRVLYVGRLSRLRRHRRAARREKSSVRPGGPTAIRRRGRSRSARSTTASTSKACTTSSRMSGQRAGMDKCGMGSPHKTIATEPASRSLRRASATPRIRPRTRRWRRAGSCVTASGHEAEDGVQLHT